MRGVIRREIDWKASLYRDGDQTPVLDYDRIVAEDGLMGEGDCVLAGVGSDELFEELAVYHWAIPWQVASLGITPQTTRPKRCDLCAELRPGHAGQAAGYAIPVHG